MEKSQMYFPVSPTIKRRIDATAKRLSIPASNIISEIITQAFSQKDLNIKIAVPSSPHGSSSNHWRNQMAKKITKLALKRPVENIKTDNQGHVLNPKDYPDFTDWMING